MIAFQYSVSEVGVFDDGDHAGDTLPSIEVCEIRRESREKSRRHTRSDVRLIQNDEYDWDDCGQHNPVSSTVHFERE